MAGLMTACRLLPAKFQLLPWQHALLTARQPSYCAHKPDDLSLLVCMQLRIQDWKMRTRLGKGKGRRNKGGTYCMWSDMYPLRATNCCMRASASLLKPACSRPACLPLPPRALLSSYSSNFAFSKTPSCCSKTSASALQHTESPCCQRQG